MDKQRKETSWDSVPQGYDCELLSPGTIIDVDVNTRLKEVAYVLPTSQTLRFIYQSPIVCGANEIRI